MNIVKIRELAKQLRKANVITESHLHTLLHAPLFDFSYREKWTEDEMNWVKENILGGDAKVVPVNMPYRNFIIYCKAQEAGDEDCTYFVSQTPFIAKVDGETHHVMLTAVECQTDSDDGNDYWVRANYTGKIAKGVIMSGWKNGVQVPFKASSENLTNLGVGIRSAITRLCYEVMSNTSAVIRVSPKPRPDKGVEWHLSRTHYCILSKKQAMHIRDKKGSIGSHQIRRAAGWRRAHFRLLKSEKFKHKRGQKVPVVECWVGPEEWVGLDSKIYKVIS